MTNMKYQILFASFLFAIALANADLKCYLCVGSEESDCGKDKKETMATQICNAINKTKSNENDEDEVSVDKYCMDIISQDAEDKPLYIRGCGYIAHNVDICDFLKKKDPKVNDCTACPNDLCN